jgi:hypothetical protein
MAGDDRKVTRALARQRRKLMRAKYLIAKGMKKKDAASKVGWSPAHLRFLLAEERQQSEQLS